MSKHEVGSTKWLSSRIKAKGLSKLKYFCQMCNKQCRDANGFKCHSQSDSHKQNMELFLLDPEKFVNDFSNEFENQFIQTLQDSAKGEWVSPKEVYSAIVVDSDHVHMNATKWATLTEFLEFLVTKGSVRIRAGEHGGDVIQFVDIAREEEDRKKAQAEAKRLEREQKREQLEKDNRMKLVLQNASEEDRKFSGPSSLTRSDVSEKVTLKIGNGMDSISKKPRLMNAFKTSSDSE